MAIAGTEFMCILSQSTATAASACPLQCQADPAKAVISTPEGRMDYTRYCLYHCHPAANQTGGTCAFLTEAERNRLMTSGGNAKDEATTQPDAADALPAEIEAPQASDATNAEEAEVEQAAKAAASQLSSADQAEDTYLGADVADAKGRRAQAAGLEARVAEAEAMSAGAVAQSAQAVQGSQRTVSLLHRFKAEIAASAVQAGIYARSAAVASDRAKKELQEIKNAPKEAAEEATQAAIFELQMRTNATIVAMNVVQPTVPPLWNVAQKAAEPYYEALQRAINIRTLYEVKANDLTSLAKTLQNSAQVLSRQAVLYQSGGKPDIAKELLSRSKDLVNQAVAADTQAQTWYDAADQIQKGLPKYQAAADYAAARAPTLQLSHWLPPPVPIGAGGPAPAPASAAALLGLSTKTAPRALRKR